MPRLRLRWLLVYVVSLPCTGLRAVVAVVEDADTGVVRLETKCGGGVLRGFSAR